MECVKNELKEFIEEVYKKDNFKIVDYDNDSNITAVYFSGNGLYFPDTYEVAYSKLIEENRFEWLNNCIPNVKRAIFIRDVHKCWYVKGINTEIDSLDKVKDFLDNELYRDESGKSHAVFVGNSAGGYAAALFGLLLGAEYIFDFAGQNTLWPAINNNSYVKEMADVSETSRYYDIVNVFEQAKTTSKLIYFYADGDPDDKKMCQHIVGYEGVYCIGFTTDVHAETMYTFNYAPLLAMSEERLLRMCKNFAGKVTSRFVFSSFNFGIGFTISHIVKKLKKKFVGNR